MMSPKVQLLIGEIQTLLGIIRQWKLESKSLLSLYIPPHNTGFFSDTSTINPHQEKLKLQNMNRDEEINLMMNNLCKLRSKLMLQSTLDEFNTLDLFKPILDIVRSSSTNAILVGAGLHSIHNLLKAGVLMYDGKQANLTIAKIGETLVYCSYEMSDTGADEIAIMWILEGLLLSITIDAGKHLTDDMVYSIVQKAFGISISKSHPDMVRSFAKRILCDMIRFIFTRIFLTPDGSASSYSLIKKANSKQENVKKSKRQGFNIGVAIKLFTFLCDAADPHFNLDKLKLSYSSRRLSTSSLATTSAPAQPSTTKPTPDELKLGLNSSHLNQLTRMEIKLVSLKLLTIAIESTIIKNGPKTGLMTIVECDEILFQIKSQLFLRLIQVSQTAGRGLPSTVTGSGTSSSKKSAPVVDDDLEEHVHIQLVVLCASLRLAELLISHHNLRFHLKVQIEAFFNAVYLRVLEGKSSSVNEALVVLESLNNVLVEPSFIVDLYVNYDCCVRCTDVFENLFKYLSRHTFPMKVRNPALDAKQLISLQCIINGINALAERCDAAIDASALLNISPRSSQLECEKFSSISASDCVYYSSEELWQRKQKKRVIVACSLAFNKKPKAGIQMLADAKLLSAPYDANIIAMFLRTTPSLDKKTIGMFLGGYEDLNKNVLRCFVNTFNFRSLTLLAALRMFLESFRLPGEAQQIDRIINYFAEAAHRDCTDSDLFPTTDCTYIFTFAIIMLNTDLHNPNIVPEKKMSLEAFIKNNTNYGPDASKNIDLPPSLLTSVYNEILKQEINTMTEGSTLTCEISDDKWRDLMSIPDDEATMTIHHPLHVTPTVAASDGHDRKIKSKHSLQSLISIMDGGRKLQPNDDQADDDETAAAAGELIHCGSYDKQMFQLIWSPSIAAMSVVFDSGNAAQQPDALKTTLDGFILCAKVAAQYNLTHVFDSITISLCKFTTLLLYASSSTAKNIKSSADRNESGRGKMRSNSVASTASVGTHDVNLIDASILSRQHTVMAVRKLGENHKAQMATMCMFAITRRFGDHVNRAWSYVLYCLLRLCDLQLVPSELMSENDMDLINLKSRLLFHEKIRETVLNNARERIRRQREQSEISGSWLSNWLFGNSSVPSASDVAEESVILDDTHSALLAALVVADAGVKDILIGGESKTEISDTNSADTIQSKASGVSEDNAVIVDANGSRSEAQEDFKERNLEAFKFAKDCVKSCKLNELISDSKHLCDDALLSFIHALILISGGVVDKPIVSPDFDVDEIVEESVASLSSPTFASFVFCLHLITEIVLRNKHRIVKLLPIVKTHFIAILNNAKQASFQVEKAIVGLLRISVKCIHKSEVARQVLEILNYLIAFNENVAPGLGQLIGHSIIEIIRSGSVFTLTSDEDVIHPTTGWIPLLDLLEACGKRPSTLPYGYEALRLLILEPSTSSSMPVMYVIGVLYAYITAPWSEQHRYAKVKQMLDLIFSIHSKLEPKLKGIQISRERKSDAVSEEKNTIIKEWIPLLKVFSKTVVSPSVPLTARNHALNLLLTAMLDNHGCALNHNEWICLYNEIIFPLNDYILQSTDVILLETKKSSDNFDKDEIIIQITRCRLQIMTLLAKVTLSYIDILCKLPNLGFETIWLRVLNLMEKYKMYGIKETNNIGLSQVVNEHMKEILLVLCNNGVLGLRVNEVDGTAIMDSDEEFSPESKRLWKVSWGIIDSSLPNIRSILFPPSPNKNVASPVKSGSAGNVASPLKSKPDPAAPEADVAASSADAKSQPVEVSEVKLDAADAAKPSE